MTMIRGKKRIAIVGLVATAALAVAPRAAAAHASTATIARTNSAAAGGTHYYLALGDSLAQGAQPIDTYPPYYYPDGYVPQVYAALSAANPKLVLDNISCGGEGTVSMIDGSQPASVASSCGSPDFYQHWYPHKTQLAEAVNFLAAHKDKAEFVTIDIGGNDVAFCLFDAADLGGCLNNVFATVATNLDTILTELQAASPDATIVGMTYYNPVACGYFFGQPEQAAFASDLVQTLNSVLVSVYTAHGVRVADVARAFSVGNGLEAEATAALKWTWYCSADHPGDVHPNAAGYHVIAHAFLDALQ
jgi:lysophospholipase L1-like esterase